MYALTGIKRNGAYSFICSMLLLIFLEEKFIVFYRKGTRSLEGVLCVSVDINQRRTSNSIAALLKGRITIIRRKASSELLNARLTAGLVNRIAS